MISSGGTDGHLKTAEITTLEELLVCSNERNRRRRKVGVTSTNYYQPRHREICDWRNSDLLLEIVRIGALLLHVCGLGSLLVHLLLVRAQLLDDPLARGRLDLQVPQGHHAGEGKCTKISTDPGNRRMRGTTDETKTDRKGSGPRTLAFFSGGGGRGLEGEQSGDGECQQGSGESLQSSDRPILS
jgi:hypothetical protein